MSATNGADIYLLHEMDGALLGMGVRTAHSNPTYIPIQLTSQPIFPRTSVLVQYSEKAQAIWLECKSGAFFAHIYYSFKDRKCIDGRYGRMINAGHEPGWVSPEYRTDTIPETPDDIKVVLKLEVGSGTGGL